MENNNYDFYGYGLRVAKSMYENTTKLREEIKEKYGVDAALQFDCGLTLANARNNLSLMEESLPKFNDIISGKIQTKDNERNNSYFDLKGTSNKYDEYGEYKDPFKR